MTTAKRNDAKSKDGVLLPKLYIDDNIQKLIDELRLVVNDDAIDEKYLDKFYLLRWLIGYDMKVNKAAKYFKQAMGYRREHRVAHHAVHLPTDQPSLFKAYYAYWPGRPIGRTKDGCLILWSRYGKTHPVSIVKHTNADFRMKFNYHVMENIDNTRNAIEQKVGYFAGVVTVNDMEGLGTQHISSAAMAVFRAISATNQLIYPETIRRQIFINCSKFFAVLWKLISPFIHKTTLKKTTVLKQDYLDTLLEIIDEESIPVEYGGKAEILPPGGKFKGPELFTGETVGRSSSFRVPVELKKGQRLRYEFYTESYDIGFGIHEDTDEGGKKKPGKWLLESQKYNSHKEHIQGSVTAPGDGKYVLLWDNSYSWTRSKKLYYHFIAHKAEKKEVDKKTSKTKKRKGDKSSGRRASSNSSSKEDIDEERKEKQKIRPPKLESKSNSSSDVDDNGDEQTKWKSKSKNEKPSKGDPGVGD